MIGRSALYYEDYVLSIQYFNQAISAKPFLYEPWFYRAVAKYYLDDYAGAEADCSEAIERNPYIVGSYELRGLCRIQQKNFEGAIKTLKGLSTTMTKPCAIIPRHRDYGIIVRCAAFSRKTTKVR